MVGDVVRVEDGREAGGGGGDAGGACAQLVHAGLAQDDAVGIAIGIDQGCAVLRDHPCASTWPTGSQQRLNVITDAFRRCAQTQHAFGSVHVPENRQ